MYGRSYQARSESVTDFETLTNSLHIKADQSSTACQWLD